MLQATFLFDAVEGFTVAVSWLVPPLFIVRLVEDSDTPDTGVFTVILLVSVYPPEAVFAVIVAVPLLFAVTRPELLTEATPPSLLLQVTDLFEAVEGATAAVSCRVFPILSVTDSGVTVIPLAGVVTVTVQVSLTDEFAADFTVMVAVPLPLAVTRPEEFTVATALLLLVQVTDLLEAVEGDIVAVSCLVLPTFSDTDSRLTVTPVVGVVTVTVQEAVAFAFADDFTVMTAVPLVFAVTLPEESTVATEVLLLDQVTALFVALLGLTVAVRVALPPGFSDRVLLEIEMPVTATTGSRA